MPERSGTEEHVALNEGDGREEENEEQTSPDDVGELLPLFPSLSTENPVVPMHLLEQVQNVSSRWTRHDETAASSRGLPQGMGFDQSGRRFAALVMEGTGLDECDGETGLIYRVMRSQPIDSQVIVEEGVDCEGAAGRVGVWMERWRSEGFGHGKPLVWTSAEAPLGLHEIYPLAVLGPPLRGYMLYADGFSVRLVDPDNGRAVQVSTLQTCSPQGNAPRCDCSYPYSEGACACCPLGISIDEVVLSPTGRHLALVVSTMAGGYHDAASQQEIRWYRLSQRLTRHIESQR